MTLRTALIGNLVKLPTGETGKVTGISVDGIARVVVGMLDWRDVPQEQLISIPRKGE